MEGLARRAGKGGGGMSGNFTGFGKRECSEHRTAGVRAWCFDCHEWCYPTEPCKGCRLPLSVIYTNRLAHGSELLKLQTLLTVNQLETRFALAGKLADIQIQLHRRAYEGDAVEDIKTLIALMRDADEADRKAAGG